MSKSSKGNLPLAAGAAVLVSAGIVYTLYIAYPGREMQSAGDSVPTPVVQTEQVTEPSVETTVAEGAAPVVTLDVTEEATDSVADNAAEPIAEAEEGAETLAKALTEESAADGDMTAMSDSTSDEDAAPMALATDDPEAPSFDLVRIPAEGLTTVAGRAAPGSLVRIVVDGKTVAETEATVMGEFVLLFDLPSDPAPREMRIETEQNGEVRTSVQTVLISAVDPSLTSPEPEEGTEGAAPSEGGAPMQAEATGGSVARDILDGAKPAPTVLMADENGVRVLQQEGTSATELRIDAVSYDPEGRVFVSGRAAPETQLMFYLDDALVAETTSEVSGQWRQELEDVAAGLYTLRVDQVGDEAQVLNRAEIPFQREEVADLVALTEGADASAAPEGAEADTGAIDVDTMDGTEMAAEAEAEGADAEASDRAAIEAQNGQEAVGASQRRIASVTVQPGNSLWQIAQERYGDGFLYVRVFDANRDQIRNPDLIYPGQVFDLPE